MYYTVEQAYAKLRPAISLQWFYKLVKRMFGEDKKHGRDYLLTDADLDKIRTLRLIRGRPADKRKMQKVSCT